MAQKEQDSLAVHTKELTKDFERWDYLYTHGGQDPFHSDGANLNLVRNHIFYHKRKIEELLKEEQDNTFFSTPYPDIYYRPTPDKVPWEYMARADELLKRGNEQMALYKEDPNYQYIVSHFKEAFPKGETRAHRAAGIHPGMFYRFISLQDTLDSGNLVDIRRRFYSSYEENKKDLELLVQKMRAYLEADHFLEDSTPVSDWFDEDSGEELCEELEASDATAEVKESPSAKLSLDVQILSAKSRLPEPAPKEAKREEQLSLF